MAPNYSLYKQTEINTSQPLKLVLMLYDGAINFLKKSIEYAEHKDIKNKNIYAKKAQDIIMELNNYLNLEAGGEIALNLKKLYFFMNRHVMASNWNNDLQGLKEVIQLLANLREAWQDIDSFKNTYQPIHSKEDNPTYPSSGLRI